jgi:hypothetical protein
VFGRQWALLVFVTGLPCARQLPGGVTFIIWGSTGNNALQIVALALAAWPCCRHFCVPTCWKVGVGACRRMRQSLYYQPDQRPVNFFTQQQFCARIIPHGAGG